MDFRIGFFVLMTSFSVFMAWRDRERGLWASGFYVLCALVFVALILVDLELTL